MGALPEIGQNSPTADALAADPLHETKSEVGDGLHEIKSEFQGSGAEALHETESEFGDGLHEIKSDFRPDGAKALHETTSELAEQVAQRLLEGLRRAAVAQTGGFS